MLDDWARKVKASLTGLTGCVMIMTIDLETPLFDFERDFILNPERNRQPNIYLRPKVVQLSACSCRETRSSKIGVFNR